MTSILIRVDYLIFNVEKQYLEKIVIFFLPQRQEKYFPIFDCSWAMLVSKYVFATKKTIQKKYTRLKKYVNFKNI